MAKHVRTVASKRYYGIQAIVLMPTMIVFGFP